MKARSKIIEIRHPCWFDAGVIAAEWPDEIQLHINRKEMAACADHGRHADQVIDRCVGSHDSYSITRTLYFYAPSSADDPPRSLPPTQLAGGTCLPVIDTAAGSSPENPCCEGAPA